MVKPVTKLVYFEIIINSFFEAVATETSLSFSFYSKLKAEKEDLVNTRNQLSADLERLLNQREVIYESVSLTKRKHLQLNAGADPGFFLGGGALVSCSTSTPINHIVFFFWRIPVVLDNRRSSQGEGGGAHPLHPPPGSAPGMSTSHVLPQFIILFLW